MVSTLVIPLVVRHSNFPFTGGLPSSNELFDPLRQCSYVKRCGRESSIDVCVFVNGVGEQMFMNGVRVTVFVLPLGTGSVVA